MAEAPECDYVVVGGGSAGSAVAARLSESGRFKVVLLEAGDDDRWIWFRVPLGAGFVLLKQRGMWRFQTEPEPHMAGRRMFWPRGRVLGGSSTINGMLWVRGEPAEYDHWRELGNRGWGYADILPFLKRVESDPQGDPVVRGREGPVPIDRYGSETLGDAFHAACVQAGIPANPDYNGASYEGVGYLQSNTRNGLRMGGRESYLDPARGRANLDIRTGARARRILVEGGRAVGVEYATAGATRRVRAARAVILSAGAVQSPQLLELSGIGDPARLKPLGIDVVHALPGVGENCRDHLHTRVSFECRRPVTLNDILRNPLRKLMMGARYVLTRGGHMAACTAQVHALAKTDPSLDRPDVKIQMHNLSAADPRHPTELRLDEFPGFGIGSFALRPYSTGSVHIGSADPEAPPTIVANYLADERDRRTSIAGLRLARRLAQQPALRELIVREVRPGPDADSDEALLEHVAKLGATSYHPIGSCKMGVDAMAVVDPELRVHGLRGLRVADASIMPTMVSSNTNAPSFMIGERCAQFLLDEARANATPEDMR
ncbi:MAG: GMC family oxidoreductase N-terminal domain-containing protein [Alphaproteobacteria bacterium]|nr:GMC family oxidoreductase N-terminal domain-containing protein [Alphaproteobacteria bacterium]